MKKVKSLLQLEYFRRQKYLREDSEEIALANLKLLMGSSIAALSLLVLFLLLSPFMIKGWEITPSHIGFLPAAIALCLISFYHYRKGRVSVKKSPLVLVSSPNKFQNKKYTTPEETISSIPLILPKAGLARKRFDYWCKNRNISPNILAETAGNEAIIALARLGLGLGLVPKIVLENGPFSEGVVQYSTFSQLEEYNIGFIFNPKPSGTEGAKKLQKAIIQILKDNYS